MVLLSQWAYCHAAGICSMQRSNYTMLWGIKDSNMISRNDAIDQILVANPLFESQWETYMAYWDGSSPGLCSDLSEFASFIGGIFSVASQQILQHNFEMIERFMTNGNDEVKTATATCLLENLSNSVPKLIPADRFIQLLGHNSLAYCKAWDEFTGIATESLKD